MLHSQSAGFEATAHAKMCISPWHEIVHFALQPWMQHQTATFGPQKKVSNVPRKNSTFFKLPETGVFPAIGGAKTAL